VVPELNNETIPERDYFINNFHESIMLVLNEKDSIHIINVIQVSKNHLLEYFNFLGLTLQLEVFLFFQALYPRSSTVPFSFLRLSILQLKSFFSLEKKMNQLPH